METSFLRILECPDCGKPALAARGTSSESGLVCEACAAEFPAVSGILCLLPASLRGIASSSVAASAPRWSPPSQHGDGEEVTHRKKREMEARDAQAHDYDAMWCLRAFSLLEIPATLRFLDLRRHDTLLEAGCGTGRMTPVFAARCKRLVAIDFSIESLRACQQKLRDRGIGNVMLIQADLCRLPFQDAVFDRIVSCQVLEHVPGEAARERAVDQLSRVLRPEGNLCLSAYQYGLFTRFFGPKEGEHPGGIYYFRFRRRELSDLLSKAFCVRRMTGALMYHYIAECRKKAVSVG